MPVADAGGRKRIVVLDFDGPKAEKFHSDVVKLIKKSHTVVSTDKWNSKADELDAAKVTEKNVKKIAKALKIDGIVIGKIEKRRDEYIVQLKLRAGASGELVGNRIDTKADGPRLDGKAKSDVKQELMGAIDELEENHGGGGDDDEGDAKPKKGDKAKKDKDKADDDGGDDDKGKHGAFSKKKGMGDDEDADAKPDKAKKGGDKAKKDKDKGDDEDADAKPDKAKKGGDKAKKDKGDDEDADAKPDKSKKGDKKKSSDEDDALVTKKDDDRKKKSDDGDDDDRKSSHSKKKRVAKGDDDDNSVESRADEPANITPASMLSPANRAVDFIIGMSFTARSLTFNSASDLAQPPPSYKQSVPVAGGIMDATVYPMAFSHKNSGPITGFGIEVMYDKVIKINSQKKYVDMMTMATKTADLSTIEDHFVAGAVFRYPMGPAVIGGKFLYGHQQFSIAQALPNGASTDIPNVSYSMVEPKAFLHYIVTPQIIINAEAGLMLMTSTGAIQTAAEYGKGSSYGYEISAGLDYGLTKNLFVRAAVRYEAVSLKFGNNPASMSNNRDTDPEQDVFGASDVYLGGLATIGYIY
jgi:hypothetical protein